MSESENRVLGLRGQEREALCKLRHAFEVARNRRTLTRGDYLRIGPGTARDLNAANPSARTLLGRALWKKLRSHFHLADSTHFPDAPLFFLTLVDTDCMTPVNASQVNVRAFVQRLRCGLRGLSYVGMVDLGLYANISPGTNFFARTGVNWHLHLLAWGEDRADLKCRAKAMNTAADNYWPIIPRPQGIGFHWLQVTEENFWPFFCYIFKWPRKAYRIGRAAVVDPKGNADFKFVQGKSELRPGEIVALFNLLKKFSLDDLFLAGGEAVDLRRRVLRATAGR